MEELEPILGVFVEIYDSKSEIHNKKSTGKNRWVYIADAIQLCDV